MPMIHWCRSPLWNRPETTRAAVTASAPYHAVRRSARRLTEYCATMSGAMVMAVTRCPRAAMATVLSAVTASTGRGWPCRWGSAAQASADRASAGHSGGGPGITEEERRQPETATANSDTRRTASVVRGRLAARLRQGVLIVRSPGRACGDIVTRDGRRRAAVGDG